MENNNHLENEELQNIENNQSQNTENETVAIDQTATETNPEESENLDNETAESRQKRKRGGRGGENKSQKLTELETNVEKLTAELGEMKDKYLRLYAEFDNYRRRSSRELLDMQKVASQTVLKQLLPTLDDFERATKAAEAANEPISEGMSLVYSKFTRTLEQQGLKPMDSTGEEFNPDLHEAITKIPAPTEELKGKVVDTVERGYYLNDKIIRYAKVIIGQ
jgi:molecular chaperone GrpE